jgi:hypothetical protein
MNIFIHLESAMLVGSIMNSALAYMSMHHLEEARKAIDYVIANYLKSPETLFRKA